MPSILQGGKKPMPMMPVNEGEKKAPEMTEGGDGQARSTLVSHGDGSHHIEHEDGSQTDHPHIGHALMHMAGKHSEGMHHHTHSDGMGGGHTVHTAAHGGEPEGGHDHDNFESVKSGMDQFFNEEENEGDWGKEDDGKEKMPMKSEGKDY